MVKLAETNYMYMFRALTHLLRGDKVSMLTYMFPHKPKRKIKVATYNQKADCPSYLWPCVWFGDLQTYNRVWSHITPRVLRPGVVRTEKKQLELYTLITRLTLGGTYLKCWVTEFFKDFFFSMAGGGIIKKKHFDGRSEKEISSLRLLLIVYGSFTELVRLLLWHTCSACTRHLKTLAVQWLVCVKWTRNKTGAGG